MGREILPMPITMDRRDTSLTVAETLGMLSAGRKKTRYFSYPQTQTHSSPSCIPFYDTWPTKVINPVLPNIVWVTLRRHEHKM